MAPERQRSDHREQNLSVDHVVASWRTAELPALRGHSPFWRLKRLAVGLKRCEWI
jgi:hypothetical protein